jgi:hypothetical protein
MHESIAAYLRTQTAETEEKFQQLLAEHDRLTDADGEPRLVARTLAKFRRGPVNGRLVQPPTKG